MKKMIVLLLIFGLVAVCLKACKFDFSVFSCDCLKNKDEFENE